MSVDIEAAERFVLANARIIDRRRLEALRHDRSSTGPVLDALRAYRNPDGGFGHALEPDVRGPESEPASTLRAVEILTEIGVLDDPMIAGAAAWVAQIAGADGGVPFVMPEAAKYPACTLDGSHDGRLLLDLRPRSNAEQNQGAQRMAGAGNHLVLAERRR
jgi:hypothetical protein